jgi:cell wall-associated NlpC family hydrolase
MPFTVMKSSVFRGAIRSMLTLLCCILFMSFSTAGHAQSTAKEIRKEQRKLRKVQQRAEAEKRRTQALYADADFHDEEDTEIVVENRKPVSEKVIEADIERESAPNPTLTHLSNSATDARIITYASTLKGIPYRYGGADRKGFDCSGFSSHVFSKAGVTIPRTAQEQYNSADMIPSRKAQQGDLLFFGKNKRKISHVGIVVSAKGEPLRMIHSASSGGIMVTVIDSSAYWKSRLLGAGRYLSRAEIRAAR